MRTGEDEVRAAIRRLRQANVAGVIASAGGHPARDAVDEAWKALAPFAAEDWYPLVHEEPTEVEREFVEAGVSRMRDDVPPPRDPHEPMFPLPARSGEAYEALDDGEPRERRPFGAGIFGAVVVVLVFAAMALGSKVVVNVIDAQTAAIERETAELQRLRMERLEVWP